MAREMRKHTGHDVRREVGADRVAYSCETCQRGWSKPRCSAAGPGGQRCMTAADVTSGLCAVHRWAAQQGAAGTESTGAAS